MAKRKMKLASGGKRFIAAAIDAVPGWIILSTLVVKRLIGTMQPLASEFGYSYYNSYEYGVSGFANVLNGLIIYALAAAYVGVELFFMSRSETIGKAIMGLKVVDSKKGRPIGFGKMLFREVIVKKASQVVFYLGYIWILIDDYSRAWHDKILDTYVVDEKLTIMTERMEERAGYMNYEPAREYNDYTEEPAAEYTADSYNEPGAQQEQDLELEPGQDPLYFINE